MSTNAAGLYILCSVLPLLSTIAVGARLYVRNVKKQKLGVDDGTALVGLVRVSLLATSFTVLMLWSRSGYGVLRALLSMVSRTCAVG